MIAGYLQVEILILDLQQAEYFYIGAPKKYFSWSKVLKQIEPSLFFSCPNTYTLYSRFICLKNTYR